MKKTITLIMTVSLILTSCAITPNTGSMTSSVKSSAVTKISESKSSTKSKSEKTLSDTSEEGDTSATTAMNDQKYQEIEDQEIANQNMDLSNKDLQRYLRDRIYSEAVTKLNSDQYCVDSVQTVYYSKEYIDQLTYNSQENVYFGFTQSQLDKQFQGKKYVFTLDENSGKTIVEEVETYEDHTTEEVLKNVAIGSGVILVCVTVSVATGGTAPAISMIFAMGAKTGTAMALSGGAIGGISAGIVKGYQTGSVSDALSASAVGASEGFKWGAITGALAGTASETWGLHAATENGLTMNEAAQIQQESKYPLDLISQFKSKAEYNIYKNAGLRTQMVDGKLALIRDIDWSRESTLPNGDKVTNLWRAQHGYAPVDSNGIPYELHHVNQDADGTLAILTKSEHRGSGQGKILNQTGKIGVHNAEKGIPDSVWNKQKQNFWKDLAKQFSAG